MSLSLSSLGLTIVTRSSQAVLDILKNYKRSRTQLQDSFSKLMNKITFHSSLELFTGCPSKHVGYKLSTLCHSFFSDTAPVYLSDLLHVYSPSRQLRSSSDSRTLCILLMIKTKTFGHRSFSYATPSVWNSLPHEIRRLQSTTAFKTALKTHLSKFYLC